MSLNTDQRMFWFRGSTMAVGGRIVSPVSENIDAQAACILPPTGGFAAASIDRFNYKNIISFKRATGTVSGQKVEYKGNKAGKAQVKGETLVTVAIDGLNVLDVITADRVVARMTSRHAKNEEAEPQFEPEMLPFGSYFENLRIGGELVGLRPYSELVREGTYTKLIECHTGGRDTFKFTDAHGDADGARIMNAVRSAKQTPSVSDQVLLAPLFNLGDWKSAPSDRKKLGGEHGIPIPGFGIVYFGEYLITRTSRRLTMLRIELGCPITGSIVCGNVDTNGHWDP
jgi:hypothetical protein